MTKAGLRAITDATVAAIKLQSDECEECERKDGTHEPSCALGGLLDFLAFGLTAVQNYLHDPRKAGYADQS